VQNMVTDLEGFSLVFGILFTRTSIQQQIDQLGYAVSPQNIIHLVLYAQTHCPGHLNQTKNIVCVRLIAIIKIIKLGTWIGLVKARVMQPLGHTSSLNDKRWRLQAPCQRSHKALAKSSSIRWSRLWLCQWPKFR